MTEKMALGALKIGEELTVLELNGEESMKQRLRDLGITDGTRISCVMISPLGDPKAYSVRGTIIALRKEDADNVVGIPTASEQEITDEKQR